jgi:nitrous oxidase accessory protein
MKNISDSRIARNVFRRNTVGVFAEASSRLEVRENDFEENGWALRVLSNCAASRFTRNNFVGNSFDVATNSRRNENEFAENYWDSYAGYDLARDGRGDVPHHPVRLFSLLIESNEPALALLRSPFVDLLDAAERVIPALTPETLTDREPVVSPYRRR